MKKNHTINSNTRALIIDENGEQIETKVISIEGEQSPFAPVELTVRCRVERFGRDDSNNNRRCETDNGIPAHMRFREVIFNPPATVVNWEDGTKTVVKCDVRDAFDPKYGLALCFMKKALGNTSRNLNDVLHTVMEDPDAILEQLGLL